MSSQAVSAVLEMSPELTSDEFRLLALIAESSSEHDNWLEVSWDRVLSRSGLTIRQCGRLLRGLQIDRLIAVASDNWTARMIVSDPRLPMPINQHVFIWIDGMGLPEARQSPDLEIYRKQPIPPSLRKQVLERDQYACRYCGSTQTLTVDHIHPESKGGTMDLDNLQTLCRSCNSRKGARSAEAES